ncbi:hypothetical protein T03_7978 [Trichinella britovi]|uniref:Uncharacterized protein n=1 Tax=Trichinella britovi TaxID=45882 RepID=A0A0V1B852_TRIBR|nr:hypothetical protein T03_7978 [Trichinella britovi]
MLSSEHKSNTKKENTFDDQLLIFVVEPTVLLMLTEDYYLRQMTHI